MGWFGGLITQQSQEDTRHLYDYYCVQLEVDQSTRKMKLPLDKHTGDSIGCGCRLPRVCLLRASVDRDEYVGPNVTLVDQEG